MYSAKRRFRLFRSPAFASFSPQSIPALNVWLDAADSTTFTFSTGSNVTQWRDKTSNAYAYTASNITLTTLSNYPALSNTGTGYIASTALNIPSPYSIFVVANCSSNADSYQRLVNGFSGTGGSVQNNTLFMGTVATNVGAFIGNGSSFNDSGSNIPAVNAIGTMLIYTGIVNGTSLAPFTTGNPSTVKTGSGSAATLTGLNFGGGQGTLSNSGSQTWRGHIMEVVVYSTALIANQRQQVEGYLAWKWGVQASLPGEHPYKLAAP